MRSEHVSKQFLGQHLQKGFAVLGELVDRKIIPGTALEVLLDRLQLGVCICGEDLRAGSSRHAHVADLIEEQKRVEPRLTALLHEARHGVEHVPLEDGEALPLTISASFFTSQLLECQDLQRLKHSDLDVERKKREQIVDSGVQSFTDRLNSNRSKRSEFDREHGQVSAVIHETEERLAGCKDHFENLKNKAVLNDVLKRQSDVAEDFLKLTDGTLARLKSKNTLNKGSEGFSGGYWGSFAEILRPPGLFSQMCRPLISLRRGRCNL